MDEMNTNELATAEGQDIEIRPIEIITAEIWVYKAQAGRALLEIGRRLIEAKAQLAHGEWLPWLKEKVEFSEATAQRFMKIAKEYPNPSPVTDLGVSKALALLALPATEREEFVAEKHVVNGEEKTVAEMSKRELEKAIRERDEAVKKAEALEQTMKDQLEEQQTVYDVDMAQAQEKLDAANRRAEDAAVKLRREKEKAAADLTAAGDELASLREQLWELQNGPAPEPTVEKVVDTEAIEAAAKAAKEEAEQRLKTKIERAEKAKAAAEQNLAAMKIAQEETAAVAEKERQVLTDQVQSLQKKLAVASSGEITVFKLYFDQAQQAVNKMADTIENMKKAGNTEDAEKLTNALQALLTTSQAALK